MSDQFLLFADLLVFVVVVVFELFPELFLDVAAEIWLEGRFEQDLLYPLFQLPPYDKL